MKKLLLLLVLVFGVVPIIYAQRGPLVEVVYLKNGSIIRGIIVEQIPNVSLKIETADGSLFVFEMDEVERITKEPPIRSRRDGSDYALSAESINQSGRMMGMVQFVGIGYQDSFYDYYDEGAAFLSFHFIYGYQFRNQFFVGGGVGMEHLVGDGLTDTYNLRVPVFASSKINLNKRRVSPFFQFDLGYHFNTEGYIDDGFFFHPKFGLDFNMGWSMRKALFLSFSFVEYGVKTEVDYYGLSYNDQTFYAKIGVNFGLRF